MRLDFPIYYVQPEIEVETTVLLIFYIGRPNRDLASIFENHKTEATYFPY